MKRKLSAILLAGLLTAGLAVSGCGAGSGNKESGGTESSYGSDMAMDDAASAERSDAGMPDTNNQAATEDMDMAMSPEEAGSGSLDATPANTAKHQNQKLIYTYNYSVETKEFDSFYKNVIEKTTQLGGYVQNSETDGSASDGTNRYASLTLRIPADQMDQILTLLNSDSNITYQNCSSEDVTLQYVDMEAHLKALRTEQETLLNLLEKADKLKDVIALQSQLTDIRYEIESYESQLRMYDNLVDYSTLYLNISEVERTTNIPTAKTSFFEEIGNRFSDNVYALGQWLRAMAVWLIGSLPVLVPLAVIVAGVVIFIRKRAKRRSRYVGGQAEVGAENADTDVQD